MSLRQEKPRLVPFPVEAIDGLLATAARAPSILNTQPWLFRVTTNTIELYADPSRKLRSDLTGLEMLISCGAALFGLRLAIRALGYQPVVGLLQHPERPSLLASVRLGERSPMTDGENRMISALPHRHTHRGAYISGSLPRGLLIGLQHDAVAEHAALSLVDRPADYAHLAAIVARAAGALNADSRSRADVRRWVRPAGTSASDGVPAWAIASSSVPQPGRLTQRDLGGGVGLLESDGTPSLATAILLTSADTTGDWLRAGQALYRVLAHAAVSWVFATLYSQPLESAPTRALIRSRLRLAGAPQLLLQFGLARTTRPTARRPAGDMMLVGRPGIQDASGHDHGGGQARG